MKIATLDFILCALEVECCYVFDFFRSLDEIIKYTIDKFISILEFRKQNIL